MPGNPEEKGTPAGAGIPAAEEIRVGDVVRTRKGHPCGGCEWTVVRTGADVKIRCNTCGRLVMMDRETFLRRRKSVVSRAPFPT